MGKNRLKRMLAVLCTITMIMSPFSVYADDAKPSENTANTTEMAESDTESDDEASVSADADTQNAESNTIMSAFAPHKAGYIDSLDDDDEYIEMFKVLEQQDGTSPFDSDDSQGDDSSDSNHIVRTFDYINYTLQFTSAPYTD